MKTKELGPSLLRALAEVPDPRSRHGRRHPLPAILALATVALLCGAHGLAPPNQRPGARVSSHPSPRAGKDYPRVQGWNHLPSGHCP
jgi:hypothetical protein